jgi:hypothetical protein
MPGTLDEIADELYATNPDHFVPARDDAVARAKEAGDRDLARAIGRLRRPTKAAWLANLLARHRAEQLDGLLALSVDLADAQRTLDGATLRALSSQRNRLVAAMAREAGRLAAQAGDSAGDSVLRDVAGILEAALADPGVADEVRAGRLSRTVSYSGFGPAAEPGTVPVRAAPVRPPAATPVEEPEQDQAERERLAAERAAREQALADAERAEAAARDRRDADEAARVDAEQDHADARSRVAELTSELDAARERERAAAGTAREAGVTARESARAAATAATVTARARGELSPSGPPAAPAG